MFGQQVFGLSFVRNADCMYWHDIDEIRPIYHQMLISKNTEMKFSQRGAIYHQLIVLVA